MNAFDDGAHLYSASVGQKIIDTLEQQQTKYGWVPVFINKLSLKHTHTHLVTHTHICFCTIKAEWLQQRLYDLTSPKYLL